MGITLTTARVPNGEGALIMLEGPLGQREVVGAIGCFQNEVVAGDAQRIETG